jgi:hypothetical protein
VVDVRRQQAPPSGKSTYVVAANDPDGTKYMVG